MANILRHEASQRVAAMQRARVNPVRGPQRRETHRKAKYHVEHHVIYLIVGHTMKDQR